MNPLPSTSRPRSRMSRRRLLAGAGACLLAAGTTGAIAAAAFAATTAPPPRAPPPRAPPPRAPPPRAATTGAASARAAADVEAAALGANWYESAPYYSTLDSSAPDLGQVMAATGQKAFEMAFILAGGGCTPAWDGTDPVSSDTQVGSVINEMRNDGGDVIVSAGGYNGTKLGQVCGSASATAAAYQQVITKYGLHAMDFDLEEPEIESSSAIASELGAAQILQQNNPGLFVSVTMPSTPTGANYFGGLLLDEAKSLGFTPPTTRSCRSTAASAAAPRR